MVNPLWWILIISIIVIITSYIVYVFVFDQTEMIVSNVDGKKYRVQKGQHNKTSANALATTKRKLSQLVNYMYKHNLPSAQRAQILSSRFKHAKFREIGKLDNSAAFTVNKGQEIRICTKDKVNGEPENLNSMMFVALHELAHVMSDQYGHNEEFKQNFSYLTHLAVKLKLYTPENFSKEPVEYCGTKITNSPLQFD